MQRTIGKYEILERLGAGATAEVYRARDTALGRDVAIKLLKPALVTDADAFQRFMQEAQAAANLFHDHIATVLDIGEAEGRFFLAMRYVNGQSLDTILRQDGPLAPEETARLAQQIGSALDYAHRQGFLHRDVKPSNIVRDQQGGYWLTDFGLTKAMMSTGLTSHTGAVLGTPSYIAPEVWLGEPASPATDQYALACVIFEALTGQVLFTGETPPAVMTGHVMKGPQKLTDLPQSIPSPMHSALEKALSKECGQRYPNCETFAKALNGAGEYSAAVQRPAVSVRAGEMAALEETDQREDPSAVEKPPVQESASSEQSETAKNMLTWREKSMPYLLLCLGSFLFFGWGSYIRVWYIEYWEVVEGFLLGLLGVISGIGLLKKKRWARYIAMVFAGIIEVFWIITVTPILIPIASDGADLFWRLIPVSHFDSLSFRHIWLIIAVLLLTIYMFTVLGGDRYARYTLPSSSSSVPAGLWPVFVAACLSIVGIYPALRIFKPAPWVRTLLMVWTWILIIFYSWFFLLSYHTTILQVALALIAFSYLLFNKSVQQYFQPAQTKSE